MPTMRNVMIAGLFAAAATLDLDPGSVEANLYRVYMLLSRGEKESAQRSNRRSECRKAETSADGVYCH